MGHVRDLALRDIFGFEAPSWSVTNVDAFKKWLSAVRAQRNG